MSDPALHRTTVLYDFLQVGGGAERVSLMLAERLPAQLVVSAVHPGFRCQAPEMVRTLSGRPLPERAWTRAWHALDCFSKMRPDPSAGAALFSGHYAPMAAHSFPNATRCLYLHGPPLALGPDATCPDPTMATSLRRKAGARLLGLLFRRRYLDAVDRMHHVLANAEAVAKSFESATDHPAEVLAPPVEADFFAQHPEPGRYWLSMARHAPGKRIERIIEAFRSLHEVPLVVAGDGELRPRLERLAAGAPNIHFVGMQTTASLAELLRHAVASIHVAAEEPFGMAIAESLAAGKPVVLGGRAGASSYAREGFSVVGVGRDPRIEDIRDAVLAVHRRSIELGSPEAIRASVRCLRQDRFLASIRERLQDRGRVLRHRA